MKNNWKNTWEYQRILEILNDYWLSEPDEKTVNVSMYFEHADGRQQEKQIIWRNKKYLAPDPEESAFMTAAEILREDLQMPTLADVKEDDSFRWVSCKDRMPEKMYEKCLVIIDGVRPSIDIAIWLANEWEQTEIRSDGYARRMNITDQVIAWMPLPEIPKELRSCK